jgi:hypothetical protein
MMTPAARTLSVFGLYLLAAGGALLLVPALMLQPLGVPVPADVWVRVVGLLAIALGLYYRVAARAELLAFMRMSVRVRLGVACAFVGFIVAGLAPVALLGFGLIDAAGAAWTARALRQMGTGLAPQAV